ncbi:precorrin-2 C20-methyltransferase [Alkaliphilus metalliredigens QYMF]|uniref:Precorrin-2 C20-methyltransferase n=1 Tax=Alkaliphilus metalliredigens (strain QYMF) TaxID=293826 RepID=A6TJE8_ALKMQ|nr:precorrin-2 C(20)-methyltransferase [Alkaliphilus metalliredigens]ABR46316.1 precorrin-2 C20-methyltransferase [Alkaliphilus metalliredigens QYMF]
MKGKLTGIGVGPGEKDLLTLRALDRIKEADIIFCPQVKVGESSIALEIVQEYIPQGTIIQGLCFPMTPCPKTLEANWQLNLEAIKKVLDQGKKAVFLTLGDALLYSTYNYMVKELQNKNYEVETVPGIPSYSAIASRMNRPLAEGKEVLSILPLNAEPEQIKKAFEYGDNLVVLKISHDPQGLKNMIQEADLEACLIVASNFGHENEIITEDTSILDGKIPYLSTAIITKNRKTKKNRGE